MEDKIAKFSFVSTSVFSKGPHLYLNVKCKLRFVLTIDFILLAFECFSNIVIK